MTVLEISRTAEVRLRLPIHVVDTEGNFGVYTGETVALGLSGVVARLPERLPSTCETTVQIELPDGASVVAAAVVAEGVSDGHEWVYRLVLPDLKDIDFRAISSLFEHNHSSMEPLLG